MGTAANGSGGSADGERRAYDSPLRRQQVAETHDRIVAAGSELVHELPSWDWRELTFRAVAERAGVGERTVYRHFPTERHLRDAVMERLEAEAGVTYVDLTLDDIPGTASLVFASLHSFAVPGVTQQSSDPTLEDADARRKEALLRAVADAAPQWSDAERETAAALLDVLWNLPSYERLVNGWRLDGDRASAAIGWLIGRLVEAIEHGEAPPTAPPRRRRSRAPRR